MEKEQRRMAKKFMADLSEAVVGLNRYRCVHCGKEVTRKSDKAWIKSYCADTGKNVRLVKVK